jgi:hypothetical protein
MKNIFTMLFVAAFYIHMVAAPVDQQTAMKTGRNFIINNTTGKAFKNGAGLQLAYKSVSDATGSSQVYFYVFNSADGFVIVSADDQTIPVLGYSDEGQFDGTHIPYVVAKWLENYKSQIRYVVENNIPATPEISGSWAALETVNPQSGPQSTTTVTPLLTTKWNQIPFYNDMCPYDNTKGKRAPTGCVATAMAQVMKFWNWPSTGMGFHSYNDLTYGIQSASFGGTTYDWNRMPLSISASNTSVSTLMYHCGVSVNMTYGVDESSAYVISAQSPIINCAEYALKTYFGYKTSLSGIQRSNFNDGQWISILEKELNAGRPVIYSGFGTGGGHAFVCDGFDLSNNMHMNWGWGGAYNGYYPVNALNPTGIGTGGGSGGYNNGQQAIIGIEPAKNVVAGDLKLYDYVTPSANTFIYGKAFSVKTNLKNYGTIDFSGDLCAAVFDSSDILIDYVQIKSGQTLSAGTSFGSDLVFATTGSYLLLPGTYTIGVYYRPAGGNWSIIANNAGYTNAATIKIVSNSAVEMYNTFVVSPQTLTLGQPVSITVKLANTAASKFAGTLNVSLFNFDGANVCNLQTLTGDTILSGTGSARDFNFSNSKLTVTTGPGTYLLAVLYKADGSALWQVAGSTYFQNPIKVIVKAPAILPDTFEQDDDILHAYTLNPQYSFDAAYIATAGSNIHTATDEDFYKIYLPYGYDFTIKANLDDARYNSNGASYTLDAVFSYSVDGGKTWSNTYDDIMAETTIKGGTEIYFKVAPYFGGQTGTYLLEINLGSKKNGISGRSSGDDKKIRIFPDPASDYINLDLSETGARENLVIVRDIEGREMYEMKLIMGESFINLPVSDLKEGIYVIQVENITGIYSQKIMVSR